MMTKRDRETRSLPSVGDGSNPKRRRMPCLNRSRSSGVRLRELERWKPSPPNRIRHSTSIPSACRPLSRSATSSIGGWRAPRSEEIMRDMTMFDFVTLAAAVGAALVAGSFFAFSTFVMGALGKIPPAQAIAAMQSINVVVINPWFMTAFVGTAVLCAVVAVASLVGWREPGAAYLLAGAVLYLAGTFGVTMVFNVPRNDALAKLTPSSAEAARFWVDYLSTWTVWNHVRTIAALGAMLSFTMAFRLRG
jgi:uncharacterized membrane protein